jgi:hypothetical protein
MHSICVVTYLHATVNNIKILSAAQQCFYDKFISSKTMQIIRISFIRNYIPGNLHSVHTLHIKSALEHKNFRSRMAFFRRTYNLAEEIVMSDTSLRSFSDFVSVGVKHFTRSDGINQL